MKANLTFIKVYVFRFSILFFLSNIVLCGFSRRIEIEVKVGADGRSLILLPEGSDSINVDKSDSVIWFSNDNRVDFSIENIDDKDQVFHTPPTPQGRRRVEGIVRSNRPLLFKKIFNYKVVGTINNGSEIPVDPKIAIDPIIHRFLSFSIIVCLIILFGYSKFQKRQR